MIAPPTRRPSLVLLLLCLLFASLLAAQMLLPSSGLPVGAPVTGAAATPVATNLRPGFSMRPLDAFSEVIERPLFRPDRRPAPAVTETATASANSRQDYALLGVVIDDNIRMALLRPKGAKQMLRILEGQKVDGWTIETVRADRVVLRRGGVTEEVRLRDLPSNKRRKPPAPAIKTAAEKPKEKSKKADTQGAAKKAPDREN